MTEIAFQEIRYIKLGPGGRWERACLDQGELHFGYAAVPHELCAAGDWEGVVRRLVETEGKVLAKARDARREIRDFYTLGPDCLWITFAHGHLWWTYAEPEVQWLGGDGVAHGPRSRTAIGGWRNTDLKGSPLRFDALSTRLTKVAAYRQTICRIEAQAYLLRRITGTEEPLIAAARQARAATIGAAEAMIANLHWADFETLVDLIFSRTGWQRSSRVGGFQKDIDLVVQECATGERAFVQVKSRAGAAQLQDYIRRFDSAGTYDRLFFVCHTETDRLDAADRRDLHIWTGSRLADLTVKAGLFDWLIEKSA